MLPPLRHGGSMIRLRSQLSSRVYLLHRKSYTVCIHSAYCMGTSWKRIIVSVLETLLLHYRRKTDTILGQSVSILHPFISKTIFCCEPNLFNPHILNHLLTSWTWPCKRFNTILVLTVYIELNFAKVNIKIT